MIGPQPARFLALGDSYTIGEGVAESERWPVQLSRMLRAAGVPVKNPEIIAATGWTTDDLARAIAANPPAGPFDLVTLLIGVNNQYRGRLVFDFRAELGGLLGRSVSLAGGDASRVIVVSIPDWGLTPYNKTRDRAVVSAEIDDFNRAAEMVTRAMGSKWVDITDISRVSPGDVVSDQLHPNARMYTQWVERVEPVALAILQRP